MPSTNFPRAPKNNSSSASASPWRANWLTPQLTAEASTASNELDSAKRTKIYADIQRKLRDVQDLPMPGIAADPVTAALPGLLDDE